MRHTQSFNCASGDEPVYRCVQSDNDVGPILLGEQQKKLDAERRKFGNGMSTSFEVLSFQRDLADAELAEIRAALDYVKALTGLERAKGTLLESRGLALDQ